MFGLTGSRLLAGARAAMRARDWPAAAQAYQGLLQRRPRNDAAWVQLGHALKEGGDLVGARKAYERALGLNSNKADSWLQLGHVLKLLGERAQAVDAYAGAAARDPGLEAAARELIALGARDRLPDAVHAAEQTPRGDTPAASDWRDQAAEQLADSLHGGVYAKDRYDAFRRNMVIPRPPDGGGEAAVIHVVIDADQALAAEVRATLSSLLDQVSPNWRATVVAPPVLANHPVASLARIDSRVGFSGPGSFEQGDLGRLVLLLRAGTVLDRHAIGWFAFAMGRTGCAAAYCDHDRSVGDWRDGLRFNEPILHPMYDPHWFQAPDTTPAVILVDTDRVRLAEALQGASRAVLARASAVGPVGHIPLMLASVRGLAPEAASAMSDPGAPPQKPAASQTQLQGAQPESFDPDEPIEVVIQTRDQPDLLRACVDSLRKTSARPQSVRIHIVDNRSVESDTHRLLRRLRAKNVMIETLDEPFNWSRANNKAAAGGDAPILVFLNNDTEMLTEGWDLVLRQALAKADLGVLGALLLYPDRTIQHAGMIFGMGAGQPLHEGVGRPVEDIGPQGRWSRSRSACAVTGAFMAMRRQVFEELGGFDAQAFSIAFNDVDLCLRARARDLEVVMTSDIQLVHHESKTRGINVTRSQIAFDLEEAALIYRRWGTTLLQDPGYNPHWTRRGQPFDGFRYPALREIVRHIDRSAVARPWRALKADQIDETDWW